LPFIEFAYNRSVHSTTEFSPFEIVYGFNPLTPMDLIPLPIDEMVSLDGNRKAQVVKTLHESVRQQIEKRNRVYATKANKGRKHVVCLASTFEIRFLFVFFISCSLFSSYPTYLGVVSSRLLIARLSSQFCFASYIYIYIYIWIALPSWFYLVLVSISQQPQEGETRGVSM